MGDGSSESCHPLAVRFAELVDIADLALSQKLAEELKYEQEANSEAEEPEFLTAFKKRGVWEVSWRWLSLLVSILISLRSRASRAAMRWRCPENSEMRGLLSLSCIPSRSD